MQAQAVPPPSSVSIVLLGKSGSGKSTLINMITNLLNDKKYADERLIAIPQMLKLTSVDGNGTDDVFLQCNIPAFMNKRSGDGQRGQQQSQTENCEDYIYITDECRLVLVDTPGMVDTGGMYKDMENSQKILNAIGSMGEIHGIVIVHKANEKRVDDSMRYMLGELHTMLSREVMENVFVALTHHTGPSTQTEGMDVFNSAGIVPKKVFTFDNDCFIPKSIMDRYQMSESSAANFKVQNELDWKKNKKSFKEMFEMLKEIAPKVTTDFKIIATNRAVLFEVGFRVGDILAEINSIEVNLNDSKEELAKFKKIAEENKNYKYFDQEELKRIINSKPPIIVSHNVPTCTRYTIVKNIIKWVEVPMPDQQKCTTCFTCKFSCHENCGLKFQETDGSKDFMRCAAFRHKPSCADCRRHAFCLECTHHYEYHGHRKFRFERTLDEKAFDAWIVGSEVTEFIDIDSNGVGRAYDIASIMKVNEDMRDRYQKACKDEESANQNIAKTQNALMKLNRKKDSLLRIICHLYYTINSLSVSPINNFYKEHIEVCKRQIITSLDIGISPEDKEKQIRGLDRLLHAYTTITNVATVNHEAPPLSQDEIMWVNKQIDKIIKTEEEIYREYGRVYNSSAKLEEMDCRKNR